MEFEITAIPTVYSDSRSLVFDLSHYIIIDSTTVVLPYPTLQPDISGIVLPFTFQTWVAVIGCFILATMSYFLFLVFGRKGKIYAIGTWSNIMGKLSNSIFVSAEVLLGQDIYCHRSGDNRLSIRFITGAWILSAFFISQSYRCNLKAMLIKPKIKLAFDSLEEMVDQKEIGYFLIKGTVLEEFLKSSPPSSLYGRIYKGLTPIPKMTPTEIMASGKYATIITRMAGEGFLQQSFKNGSCQVTFMKKQTIILRVMGLIIKKGSKYKTNIDKMIPKYIESGILNFLLSLYLNNVHKCVGKFDVGDVTRALSLKDFYGLFLAYLAGICVATLSFILEFGLHRD